MSGPLRRPLIATLCYALCVLVFEAWCWQLGRERLAGLALPVSGVVDVRIDLPFVPEAFNIERLQAAGRLVRIEGDHAWLKDVSLPDLRSLAREYWMGRISLWRGN